MVCVYIFHYIGFYGVENYMVVSIPCKSFSNGGAEYSGPCNYYFIHSFSSFLIM